ncbi:Alpha/Beta hydrolase protein [Pyronema omphalodes]|nr:Alpha/Beta hydrolase protein [Pyronema omphalodes]
MDDVTVNFSASLIAKHTALINVSTPHHNYEGIRIFHRVHPKAALLPPRLPLVVFLHGLGGQILQFFSLIEYLVHFSHVLAIDLPGCGGSSFTNKDWSAYTTASLSELVAEIINKYRGEDQDVVIIGHSMGCALAINLVTKGGLLEHCAAGVVAICPKAEMSEKEAKAAQAAVKLPECVFDVLRKFDRMGGLDSRSVNRFVWEKANEDIKRLQLKFNEESRTPVWRRMMKGLRLPTKEEWLEIRVPLLLLGATEDKVCTAEEVGRIHGWFDPKNFRGGSSRDSGRAGSVSDIEAAGVEGAILEETVSQVEAESEPKDGKTVPAASIAKDIHHHTGVVKKCIIPNAGHGVLYESPNVLCGLVGEFLSKHVNETLSLGWQLLQLKEDKWLLKNFEKWSKIQSVSPRIKSKDGRKISPFRAMKTLRQNDPNGHNPIEFSKKWTDVGDIIDLSHDMPTYDPETFGGGITYHKYSTVSKIPPTIPEVAGFIALVDSILATPGRSPDQLIACHCHYGFNRTGFFICTYLIERLGFSVKEAIEAFKEARAPGIKHPHFINELWERYCKGLQRAPTF